MLVSVVISLAIIVFTILIHGLGTTYLVVYLYRKHWKKEQDWGTRSSLFVLSSTALFLMVLHFIEIAVWAFVYLIIPDITQVAGVEEAIYFSMVTYATLGYGDIVLGPHWRIMSGFEAMNGILLFGWSTAMFFSTVQKILSNLKDRFDA